MTLFSVDGLRKEIESEITSLLNSMGIMYRMFSRTKSKNSMLSKINGNPLYGVSKKMQDYIGIRVVLYFNDDIGIVRKAISAKYEEKEKDASIDEFKEDEFRPVRFNVVYKVPDDLKDSMRLEGYEKKIDNTFELQIRTIFSEGWHEVEHDLRYKCKSDWEGLGVQSRKLNGVYAALETSEWTMVKIFDELAYHHYKERDWSAMLRQKLRMRLLSNSVSEDILHVLNNKEIAKKFYRVDRNELIDKMSEYGYRHPLNLDNIVFFMNIFFVKNEDIRELTPSIMLEEFEVYT